MKKALFRAVLSAKATEALAGGGQRICAPSATRREEDVFPERRPPRTSCVFEEVSLTTLVRDARYSSLIRRDSMKPSASTRVLTLSGCRCSSTSWRCRNVTVTNVATALASEKREPSFLNTLKYMGTSSRHPGDYALLTGRLRYLAEGCAPDRGEEFCVPYLEELSKPRNRATSGTGTAGKSRISRSVSIRRLKGYAAGNRIPAYCSAIRQAVLFRP